MYGIKTDIIKSKKYEERREFPPVKICFRTRACVNKFSFFTK